MIRKQSLFYRLISLLFVLVLSFSFVSAHSEFVVDQTNYDETSTISNTKTSVASKGDVTVTLKYMTIESKEQPDYAEFSDSNGSFGTAKKLISINDYAKKYTGYNKIIDNRRIVLVKLLRKSLYSCPFS